jgi:hypothetical protein
MGSMGVLGLVLFLASPTGHFPLAEKTAQRFMDAIARGDERALCHYMSAAGRRELVQSERDLGNRRVHTCEQAARAIPRELGRYPIVKIEPGDAGHVVVWIDDHGISDSGWDNFGMERVGRVWRVEGI